MLLYYTSISGPEREEYNFIQRFLARLVAGRKWSEKGLVEARVSDRRESEEGRESGGIPFLSWQILFAPQPDLIAEASLLLLFPIH